MNSPFVFSSISGGEYAVLLWATIGGVLVFCGLTIEKIADYLNDRHCAPLFKPHKKTESFGWYLLMAGIFIETCVACWSAHDAWQIKQIANKNNPLNLPVSDIFANVHFRVDKSDFSELPRFGNPTREADIWMMEPPGKELIAANNGQLTERIWDLIGYTRFPILSAENSANFPSQKGGRTYFLRFDWDQEMEMYDAWQYKIKVKDITDAKTLRIEVKCLPHDLEILDGSVELIINDSVPLIYEIPKQKDNRLEAPAPDTYSNTTPFVILAFLTNSPTITVTN